MSEGEDLVVEVGSGDRRRALVALRDRLAVEVERVADEGFCPACKRGSSSVAPLAQRLADVLKQLDELPTPVTEETPLERARRLRAEGLSVAAGGVGSA